MIAHLDELYNREENILAPFAVHNQDSGGRRFEEKNHPFRTDFQRDRDRILHCRAFRRLEYKTQVFLNGAGDHYRTRLTHTIEVAAVARTIARSLCLNEDLTETIALAHDLGHTPFGHAGERALQKLMENEGGFDHNEQALRIVDLLEIKYPAYDGLNLTWAVRAGLMKHRTHEDGSRTFLDGKMLPLYPCAESQVADVADDLTYYGHDVDDGLDSGLITLEMLQEIKLWRMCEEKTFAMGLTEKNERFAACTVRNLIDTMVGDLIRNSAATLEKYQPQSAAEVENSSVRMISFSPEFQRLTDELRTFLYHNLYFHPVLAELNDLSYKQMGTCFRAFLQHPELMGEGAQSRIAKDGLKRAAADFIAGMTDNFATKEYNCVSFLYPEYGKESKV
ncbi:MAG: deoxyguanosinetriphosphate triphosphohydrolase [Lentisphaeria bacterium]|nr:deoxyguanosinetriphosphate triphosphohydrolase [Lentisphaeria bacterium]